MSLFVWGRAFGGGAGAFANPVAAVQPLPPGSRPIGVACGAEHTLVVCADGSVRAQASGGDASWCRLGGSLRSARAAVVAAGAQHSCVVSRDGDLHEWGQLFVAASGGGGGGGALALAGMGHLDRNEYLRRIVQRSESICAKS